MRRQDAKQKKMGNPDARGNKNWETRHETKKRGEEEQDKKKWGDKM